MNNPLRNSRMMILTPNDVHISPPREGIRTNDNRSRTNKH